MASGPTMTQLRQRRAQEALDALGEGRATAELMSVQCHRSHHVAAVYETGVGPVIVTHPGSHGHGSKDFVDTGHHGAPRAEHLDLLDAGREEAGVPAWCDCGPVVLDRGDLLDRLEARERRVLIGG